MGAYYADSSTLVKRHVPETGSRWFTSLADPSAQARRVLLSLGLLPPVFLSADTRLLTAAQAEGFTTDDPNLH